MKWARTIEKYPDVWEDSGVCSDPFDSLRKQVARDPSTPHARLEYTAHRSLGGDTGWVKCSVVVNIACPQTERHLDLAGEVAFEKAFELMSDGLSHMTESQQG